MANYYDSFMYNSVEPRQSWEEHTQAFLDENFSNSAHYTSIGYESVMGSLNFVEIEARVLSVLDSKVGDKINDNYRTLFFSDISFVPPLGARFQFDNNVWIVYNTDNIESLQSSCYVARCNNTINMLDPYGNIHYEPCSVVIKPTRSGFVEDEEMWTPFSRQTIMFQKNNWTKNIGINYRIIFEDMVYRVGTTLNFNRQETYNNNSVYFVQCYLDSDLVNEYDNMELQIADYHLPNYSVDMTIPTEIEVGGHGIATNVVYYEDAPVSEQVTWSSSNPSVLTIDKNTGAYSAIGIGSATVYCKMVNNNAYCAEKTVSVVSVVAEVVTFEVSSKDYYIPINQSKSYTVAKLVNGVPVADNFTFVLSGMGQKYYSKTISGNTITITNKLQNENELLTVTATDGDDNSIVFAIELGGVF